MAFRARDGRAFGNRQKMKAYDERIGSQRRETGDSLESKPDQEPEEVETQNREGRTNPTRGDPTPPRSYSLNPSRDKKKEPEEPGQEEEPGEGNPGEEEPPEEASGDISHMEINDAVRAHGPAEHIEIRHRGGRHEVTSNHGGRIHRSTHPTPHAAHIHAADAAGLNPETAGAGAGPQPEQMMAIPGLQA